MKKTRVNYIDIARGAALFFVILGHLIKFNSKEFNWIFSFHMPAFFLLSGMCFDIKKYKNFKEFIFKKFKTILIPYFSFVLFGILVTTIIWKSNVFNEELLRQVFYYTQPEMIHVGQVWFLFALFISNILLYVVFKLFDNKKDIALIVMTFILIYIGYTIQGVVNLKDFTRLPFKIDTAFMATSFMLAGNIIYRRKLLDKICDKKIISLVLLIVLGTINYHFGPNLNGYVNICDCVYGNIFYYYISALSGTICLLIVSYLLFKNRVLEYYGRNSLFMFSIHSMYLFIAQNVLTNIFNKDYYFMNNIPVNLCIVTGISIYILLVPPTMIYNYIRKKIKER